jgi:hypothetical protein
MLPNTILPSELIVALWDILIAVLACEVLREIRVNHFDKSTGSVGTIVAQTLVIGLMIDYCYLIAADVNRTLTVTGDEWPMFSAQARQFLVKPPIALSLIGCLLVMHYYKGKP